MKYLTGIIDFLGMGNELDETFDVNQLIFIFLCG
jgi:hypothetical protein